MDMLYKDVLEILDEIHVLNPDLKLGMVLQTSVDNAKFGKNVDFHDLSTKKMLSALQKFKVIVLEGKK